MNYPNSESGDHSTQSPAVKTPRSSFMDILIPIGFLVFWFVLQMWILPAAGVNT